MTAGAATPDEVVRRIQRIMDASVVTAGAGIQKNFTAPGWRMTAEEFVEFWASGPMASISTVSARGSVHVTPLDPRLVGWEFRIPTFGDSQRLKDHRANPRCGITSWDGPYRAVIVYGLAREEPPDEPTIEAGELNGYQPSGMVTVVVQPTRIYGIRPPDGHRASAHR